MGRITKDNRCKVALPPPRPDIERMSSLRVLGVILNNKLTAADHVTALLLSGSSMLYAMRVLRSHGTPSTSLRTYSAQQSSRVSCTRHHRRLVCVQPTTYALIPCYVAANGWATVEATRASPNCRHVWVC